VATWLKRSRGDRSLDEVEAEGNEGFPRRRLSGSSAQRRVQHHENVGANGVNDTMAARCG
jgi:hypothetical protein